jgi:hypothetical protein
MIEITIIVSDSGQTLKKKFLREEGFRIAHDDAILNEMVLASIDDFKGDLVQKEVVLKIRADW